MFRKHFRKIIFPIEWLDKVPSGDALLDVGSGSGLFLDHLSPRFLVAQGVEVRDKYLRDTYPYILSAPSLAACDVLTVFDVLHHIPSKYKTLHNYIQRFRPSYLCIKEMSDSNNFCKLMNRIHDMIFGHGDLIAEVNAEDLITLCKQWGYEVNLSLQKRIFWYNHYMIIFKRIE